MYNIWHRWNILTDEGVIPETSPINWIEHVQMNIFRNQDCKNKVGFTVTTEW